jgi:hypothetical protein
VLPAIALGAHIFDSISSAMLAKLMFPDATPDKAPPSIWELFYQEICRDREAQVKKMTQVP